MSLGFLDFDSGDLFLWVLDSLLRFDSGLDIINYLV